MLAQQNRVIAAQPGCDSQAELHKDQLEVDNPGLAQGKTDLPRAVPFELAIQNGEFGLNEFWADVEVGLEWEQVVKVVNFLKEQQRLILEAQSGAQSEADVGFVGEEVRELRAVIGVLILKLYDLYRRAMHRYYNWPVKLAIYHAISHNRSKSKCPR